MSAMSGRVHQFMLKIGKSFRRFFETLLLLIAAVVLLIIHNHMPYTLSSQREIISKVVQGLILGALLFLCYRAVLEREVLKKTLYKAVLWTGTAAFTVFYYFAFLQDNRVGMIRYSAVLFASALLFLSIPYLVKREGFELYITKVFSGAFVAALYALVLFLGMTAILFTVDQLFSIHIQGKIYFDIFMIAAGVFWPAYFLSEVPRSGEVLPKDRYSKVLKILLFYIVMPLLMVYTAILYVYFAKVLITQKWPEGMVSHLVLWYCILTAFIIFLIRPLKPISSWAAVFSRSMPMVTLPLLALCAWAIGIRIHAYGVTESRYFVVAAVVWVLFVMLFYIFNRGRNNVFLPLSLAVIAVITVTGPWSAFEISKDSQENRFERLLVKNNMWVEGKLQKAAMEVSREDKESMTSILFYFSNTHSLSELHALPGGFTLSQSEEILGFKTQGWTDLILDQSRSYFLMDQGVIDIKGYSYMIESSKITSNVNTHFLPPFEIKLDRSHNILTIHREGRKMYERSIKDFALEVDKENKTKQQLPMENMTFVDSQNGLQVKYIFRNLLLRELKDGTVELENYEFLLLVQ